MRSIMRAAWAPLLLLGLAVSVVPLRAQEVQIPKFKWGQDTDQLYVTFLVGKTKSETVTLTNTSLVLDAESTDGSRWHVEFDWREDISAEESKWLHVMEGIIVVAVKRWPHDFDRVVTDLAKFKPYMSLDWNKLAPDNAFVDTVDPKPKKPSGSPDDDEDEFESTDTVKLVTAESLPALEKKHDVIILWVQFPWCSKCSIARSDFEKAAAQLLKKKTKKKKKWLFFGLVDAREERTLAHRFDASCPGNCDFVVLKQGEGEGRIKETGVDKLVQRIKRLQGPALTPIVDAKQLASLRRSGNGVAVIGHVDDDQNALNTLHILAVEARSNLESASFGRVEGQDTATSLGLSKGVNVLRPGEDTAAVYSGDLTDKDAMLQWIKVESVPLIADWAWNKTEVYQDLGLPLAELFIDASDETQVAFRQHMQDVAASYRGKIAFVVKDTSFGYSMEDGGLFKTPLPAFDIVKLLEKNNKDHYALKAQGEECTTGAVRSHIEAFLRGEVPQTFRSEVSKPEGEAWDGRIRRVVWNDWRKALDGNHEGLLAYLYQDYNAEHKAFLPQLREVGDVLHKVAPGLVVAMVDVGKNHFDTRMDHDKFGDPALFFVPARSPSAGGGPNFPKLSAKGATAKAVVEFVHKESAEAFPLEAAQTDLDAREAERANKDKENKAEEEAEKKEDVAGANVGEEGGRSEFTSGKDEL